MRKPNMTQLLCATAISMLATNPAQAADNGLESHDSTLVVNPSGSTITGDRKGIFADGSEFNLDNAGIIRGNGTAGGTIAPDGGVVVTGGPADITNSGTISGQRFGITTAPYGGVESRTIGSAITNSGTIIGDNDDGIRLRGGGDVTNSGYIAGRVTGGADGISMFAYDDQTVAAGAVIGTVTNSATGIIEGNRHGIILSNGGTVDNAGSISGNASGIHLQAGPTDAGRVGTITNSGTIAGGSGVTDFGLGNLIVTNSGSITGLARGIDSASAGFTLDNSGTIRGNGTTGGVDFSDGGVVVTGGPADIVNSGTISGARFGITMLPLNGEGRAIGSTVDNSGTIIGDNDDGIRLRGGGDVTNSGYISGRVTGGADGISMFAYDDQTVAAGTVIGTVTNTATGIIEGNRHGIILSNGGTVGNAGSISGNASGIHLQAGPTDAGRVGTITNSGTIAGGSGVTDFGLGNLIVNNSGSITGSVRGIDSASAGFTLDNSGTIRGNGTTGGVDFSDGGVVVTGGPADIVNSGTISGARFGITMLPLNGEGRAIGSTVDNSGTIIGDNDDGIRLRGGGTVVNSGYIAGRVTSGADGISMFAFDDQVVAAGGQIGSVTNTATGTIEGNRYGIILSNGGTVGNAGSISGGLSGIHLQAVSTDSPRVGTINNSGTIAGGITTFGLDSLNVANSGTISANGVAVSNASPTTLLNSGTISTAGATAVELGGGGDAVTLQTGSAITGIVDGGAGTDSLTLSGSIASATPQQSIGQFAGFESLTLLGGYWTAAAATGTFGAATLNGGTFAVNGSITAPVTVNSGAILGGTGTITGNVTLNSGAVLAPGNSIGTINVAGNVLFNSGSTYRVETSPTGMADRITITGAATIASGTTLRVLTGSGTYGAQTSYTILTATAGISGKFSTITSDYAFLKPTVATKSTSVILTLSRNGRPVTAAATASNFSTAAAISAFDESNPIYASVLMQSERGAVQAFDALSGAAYGRLHQLLAGEFGQVRLGFQDAGSSPDIQWSGVSSLTARGFHNGRTRSLGPVSLMMIGGQHHSQLSSDGINADVETRFFGSALGYRSGRFQWLAAGTMAWHDVAVGRTVFFPGFIEQAGSRYAAQSNRIDVEASYALSRGSVSLSPYGGYSRISVNSPAFSESGGFSALRFDAHKRSVDQLRLGVRMGSGVSIGDLAIAPRVDLSLNQLLGDAWSARGAQFRSGGQGFASIEASFAKRSANIDAGIDVRKGRLTLTGRYLGQFGEQYRDHSAQVTAALKF